MLQILFLSLKYRMSASSSAMVLSRTGEVVDLYYYDHETSKKQAFPTTINTKYVQQFNNLTGGTSVFTIPPQQGVQDVVEEPVGLRAVWMGAGQGDDGDDFIVGKDGKRDDFAGNHLPETV